MTPGQRGWRSDGAAWRVHRLRDIEFLATRRYGHAASHHCLGAACTFADLYGGQPFLSPDGDGGDDDGDMGMFGGRGGADLMMMFPPAPQVVRFKPLLRVGHPCSVTDSAYRGSVCRCCSRAHRLQRCARAMWCATTSTSAKRRSKWCGWGSRAASTASRLPSTRTATAPYPSVRHGLHACA